MVSIGLVLDLIHLLSVLLLKGMYQNVYLWYIENLNNLYKSIFFVKM